MFDAGMSYQDMPARFFRRDAQVCALGLLRCDLAALLCLRDALAKGALHTGGDLFDKHCLRACVGLLGERLPQKLCLAASDLALAGSLATLGDRDRSVCEARDKAHAVLLASGVGGHHVGGRATTEREFGQHGEADRFDLLFEPCAMGCAHGILAILEDGKHTHDLDISGGEILDAFCKAVGDRVKGAHSSACIHAPEVRAPPLHALFRALAIE